MPQHICFIVNPASGGHTAGKHFAKLQAFINSAGVNYSVVYTQKPNEAGKLAKDAIAGGTTCIIAVGGDGTISEVAQELIYTNIPLGILPFGTGNDFVRMLNLPTNSEDALYDIFHNQPRPVDAATANGRVFINVGGFGFDVHVLHKTKRLKQFIKGNLGYVLGLIATLFTYKTYNITVTTPSEQFRTTALITAVGNGRYFGGGMPITPKANITDGLLDVCIIKGMPFYKTLKILSLFAKGKHIESPLTMYFNATEITIESTPNDFAQIDGEIILNTPVTFKALPQALLLFTGDIA